MTEFTFLAELVL